MIKSVWKTDFSILSIISLKLYVTIVTENLKLYMKIRKISLIRHFVKMIDFSF